MTAQPAKTPVTIEDLYRIKQKAELVDGEIVLHMPTGGLSTYASGEIFASLREYARRVKCGYAINDNAGFLVNLPHRKSFSPDASYYLGTLTIRFLEGPPVFAAEVRSENDYGPKAEQETAAKRADYFLAGTKVVWDVDIKSEDVVKKYMADHPDEPTIFRRGEMADAEPAVPGWTMPVDDLFPE